VIFIDDGSRDDTLKIARSFEKRGVIVLSKQNGGKASALNYGFKKAKGELIATLDADSYIAKDSVKKILPHFGEGERVVAVASAMEVWNPSKRLEKLQQIEYLVTLFARKILFFLDSIHVTPGPLSVFKKEIFDEIGGYDEKNILEDQEFAYRIQAHDYRIASSMDATVYTAVPPDLPSLVKQRIRWHRGGLRNLWKYKKLANPNYGDFGMFIMPLGILSTLAVFLVLGIGLSKLFSGSQASFLKFGLQSFFLGITPLHVIAFLVFLLTVYWVWAGLKHFQGRDLSLVDIGLYLFVYTWLITLFWVATAWKELRLARVKWETK
jgi:cellulose synthase/poly-beta-1,6-N-acetylglucosamine synthase-like glycosyltransferase